jgi:hypothetical protein
MTVASATDSLDTSGYASDIPAMVLQGDETLWQAREWETTVRRRLATAAPAPHMGLQALSPENLLSALQATFERRDTVRVWCIHERSYWIPGSWNLRMVYTDAISFYDP